MGEVKRVQDVIEARIKGPLFESRWRWFLRLARSVMLRATVGLGMWSVAQLWAPAAVALLTLYALTTPRGWDLDWARRQLTTEGERAVSRLLVMVRRR